MGFLKNLFKRRDKEEYWDDYDENLEDQADWDAICEKRVRLDMRDELVREQFVRDCLDQIKIASDEVDRLSREYDVVTGYLTDMEEVEEIPQEEKKYIESIASHIKELRSEHDAYVLKESSMTDREFQHVQAMEDEISQGVKKLTDEEDYKKKVKQDLYRLEREKKAYEYRKKELKTSLDNSRGIAIISIIAAAVLAVILLLMQVTLKIDVSVGYYVSVLLAAIALTIIYLRYTSFEKELRKVSNTLNELILLENKVKIRYVNNKNLLDYLYAKYDVLDAWTLKDMYERYLQEKEDRTRFEKNEVVYQDELARLVRELRKYRIKDPEIWIHQVEALLDGREMVEARHGLIGRRQKLRKQMEYNQNIAMEASDEIKKLIEAYPDAAESIKQIVEAYENQ